jgi:NADPH:quinone reductase
MASEDQPQFRPRPVPATMKAAAIDEFGPPSSITLRTLPVPEPGPGEVLIQMYAAGLGYWDARVRDGTWAEEGVKLPLVLGTDGAGVVVAKGAHVRRLHEGDRVIAYRYDNPKGGFHAEYVAVDADHVVAAPERLTPLEAGAVAATGLTAVQGIDDVLHVTEGQTVLVFGASGAVGTLAVQFAKRRGARVLAAASGQDGMALAKQLGADQVVDARQRDTPDHLAARAPDGLDAVLALAGGEILERCLDLVKPDGRLAYPNGVEPEPGKRRRKLTVVGYDAKVGPGPFEKLIAAIEQARLQVPIAASFPLDQTDKAHQRLDKGHVLGRIALQIGPE